MQAHNQSPKGLTKIIFEAMVETIPAMISNPAEIDERLLTSLETHLRSRLAPPEHACDRVVFDLIFSRAYQEATRLLMENMQYFGYLPVVDDNCSPQPTRPPMQ